MGLGVQVTFDAADPARLADFWAAALGYVPQPPPEGYETWEDFGRAIEIPEDNFGDFAAVVDPDGRGPRLFFQRVPEGKTAKNRVHIDINPRTEACEGWPAVTAHVEKLVAAGATVLYEKHEAHGACVVLHDPEGNEFCVH